MSGQGKQGQVPDTVLLCGPTAVGKTAVAVELALMLDAEIVSVDSMQVYRGMDIGTAKPTAAERRGVPHHLIDLLEPDQAFDAAAFLRLAKAAVADIKSRGKKVLLCGGTGLYFQVFLCGLGEAPPSDAALRDTLNQTPLSELLEELRLKDPVTFERIDRRNPRRVIRAIQVMRLTGRPFSAERPDWRRMPEDPSCFRAGLSRSSGDLRRRIDQRVEEMFQRGLVEETAGLLKLGLDTNPVAMQALGYRQVVEHLRGERTLEQTISLVKVRTWQYARRQMIWFRRQLRPEWIAVAPEITPIETARQVEVLLRAEGEAWLSRTTR